MNPGTELDRERLDELRDLDRAIANFTESARTAPQELTDLLDDDEIADAGAHAHKLAGRALNLGASTAGELARSFEDATRAGRAAEARDLLPDLAAALTEACALLRQYQATSSADRG